MATKIKLKQIQQDGANTNDLLQWNGSVWAPSAISYGDISNGGNTTGAAVTIGTNDAFGLNFETAGTTRISITGAASTGGKTSITDIASSSTAVEDVLTLTTNTSGTPTTSFGTGILLKGRSATVNDREMARLAAIWTTATDASREAKLSIQLGDAGGALSEIANFNRSSSSSGSLGINGNIQIGSSNVVTITNTGITPILTYTLGGTSVPIYLTNISTSDVAAIKLDVSGNNTASSGTIGNTNFTTTSGDKYDWRMTSGYAPTSGTGTFTNLYFNGTINQTGGSTGATRAIYINPTATAAYDYRAIQFASTFTASSGTTQSTGLYINPTINITGTAVGAHRGVYINPTLTALKSTAPFIGLDMPFNNSNSIGIYQIGENTTNRFVGNSTFGTTLSPNSTNIIDIVTTTKSLGLPAMTSTQRDAITTPRDGSVVYNSTDNAVSVRANGAWVDLGGNDGNGIYSGSGTIDISGGSVYATLSNNIGSFGIAYGSGNSAIQMDNDNTTPANNQIYLYSNDAQSYVLVKDGYTGMYSSGFGEINLFNGINIALTNADLEFQAKYAPGQAGFYLYNDNTGAGAGSYAKMSSLSGLNYIGADQTSVYVTSPGASVELDATGLMLTDGNASLGTSGQVLVSDGTYATWGDADGNGIYTGSGTIPAGTVATLTSGEEFSIDYDNSNPSIIISDFFGSTKISSNTGNGSVFVQDAVIDIYSSGGYTSFSSGTSGSEVRFYEPSGSGTNYVSFTTPVLAANTTYIWPTSATNGYYLKYNTGGQLEWAAVSGGTPAGSNTYIQYNNSGAFGAEAAFTYNPSTDTMTVSNTVLNGFSEWLYATNSLNLSATSSSNSIVTLSDSSPWLSLSNAGYASTTTNLDRVRVSGTFAPTSAGTNIHRSLVIDPVINQTGTHSGETFGLVVAPTLTSIGSNFYGIYIDINDANAFGVFQSGSATPNAFNGPTMFGDVQAPQSGAAVEINSTTGGFLLPRMTTTERGLLAASPNGLVIYNTTDNKFNFRQNSAWVELGTGTVDPSTVTLAVLGSPTYSSLQDMQNIVHSTGWADGGAVTDGGSGTVNVAAGTGLIKGTNSIPATLYWTNWSAVTGLTLTDNTTNYIYVDYNGGSPVVTASVTDPTGDRTKIYLARVYRSGTHLHIFEGVRWTIADHASLMMWSMSETMPFAHVSGAMLTETGTRNLNLSSGVFWHGLTRITTSAINTSGADTFTLYYRNGVGGWTESASQTQINNTQYDNGTGTLATLSNNKYGVHWIYLSSESELFDILGQGDYTLIEAQDAQVPSPPEELTTNARLIAKIIVLKSASTFTSVEMAYMNSFNGAPITGDHGSLAGLSDDDHTQYLLLSGRSGQTVSIPASSSFRINYNSSNPGLLVDDNDNSITIGSDAGTNYVYVTDTGVDIVDLKQAHLIAAPTSDHSYSGTTITLTANENQAFGDVCYINADGEAQLGDASASTTSLVTVMCTETVSANNPATYLIMGIARDDTWAWTVGSPVYLSITGTTGNTLTQTAPSATGEIVQYIGMATHADRILFNPSPIIIEIA